MRCLRSPLKKSGTGRPVPPLMDGDRPQRNAEELSGCESPTAGASPVCDAKLVSREGDSLTGPQRLSSYAVPPTYSSPTPIERRGHMYFEIVGPITDIDTIAAGRSIRQLSRLRRQHGRGRWRKLKGIATVRIANGELRRAEIHWYEAHGIGRVRHKIKRFLD